MKNPFRYIGIMALLAMAAIMLSCSDAPDDTPDNPADTQQPSAAEWQVPEYSVVEARTYTRTGLIDRALGMYGSQMGDQNLSTFKTMLGYGMSDNSVYHEDVLAYRSVDHRGAPITLSGVVTYKTDGASDAIAQIVIDNHATITDNASAPSVGGSIGQLLMLQNPVAVVAADYQGYGISRAAVHPYLNQPLTARHQVDMLKAAVDYLSGSQTSASLSADVKTYSMGYSQGGAVALAVHRHIQQSEPALADAIGFCGSVCGDGPYSLENTLNAYLAQGFVSIPVILPMMVRSMMESYPELFGALTLSDFFTPDFLAAGGGIMALVDAKELNVMQYNQLLGSDNPMDARFSLGDVLLPQALEAGSPQMAAMKGAFERNNCIAGWTPAHPVCFFHSPDDTVVPYDNLRDLDSWPSQSYKIVTPSMSGIDHLAGAILFYTDILVKGPAHMLR